MTINQHLSANHVGSASELRVPEVVRKDSHRIRVWCTVIVVRQDTPQGRPDSEHREVVTGDNFRGRWAVIAAGREVDSGECAAEYALEKLLLLIEIAADRVRHQIPAAEAIRNLIASPIDQNKTFRLPNGKRVQQYLIHQRVDGSRGSNAEHEREHGRNTER